MDARHGWNRWVIIACIAFVCVSNDKTTAALSCFSCTWRSGEDQTPCSVDEEVFDQEEVHRIAGDRMRKQDQLELLCKKQQCWGQNQTCVTLSSLCRGNLHTTRSCNNNDEYKERFYLKDDSGKERLNPAAITCTEHNCNGEVHYFSISSSFVLTASTVATGVLTVLIPLCYASVFM